MSVKKYNEKYYLEAAGGKLVLITGASSGIGLALAKRLAEFNANIILTARSEDKLNVLADEIKSKHPDVNVYVYPCDLSKEDETKELADKISEKFGHIDILVNNAGRSIRREIAFAYDRLHDFRRTMELNYFGAIALILGFLPAMRQNQSGHIINILTMGVQFRTPQYSAYIASKSALDAASRCIAAEVQNQGVFFSQVYMPLVKTPMISPTKVYENEESWTPEEAANFILNAMVTKKPAISPTLGKIAEIFHTFIPNSAFVVMNRYFRKRKKQEKTIKVAENEGSS